MAATAPWPGMAAPGGDATLTATSQTQGNTLTNGFGGQDGTSSPIIAAFSNTVNVDASAFTGHLTISGSDDNDTMTFGTGGTTVYATTGSDTYTFNNAASDKIVYTAANQSNGSSSTDTINHFDVANDKIDISAIAQANWTFSAPNANTLDIDLNNDSTTDIVITVTGVAQSITLADFIA